MEGGLGTLGREPGATVAEYSRGGPAGQEVDGHMLPAKIGLLVCPRSEVALGRAKED